MIELSNYIDEMREREEKKDLEMEELRLVSSTYLFSQKSNQARYVQP